jgi:hypothetical protein
MGPPGHGGGKGDGLPVYSPPPKESFNFRRWWNSRQLEDEVKKDLEDRGIDLGELAVHGKGSFRDVFHPSTRYIDISALVLKPLTPSYECDGLSITGERFSLFGKKQFDVIVCGRICLFYLDEISRFYEKKPLDDLDIIFGWELIELGKYLVQRQEAQQPEYNYNYRGRTEIK